VEVVDWLVAVQSQDFAGAKWSLALRTRGVTDAQVEADFNAGRILRTHVLRPTWHFVMPADIRWLLRLTAPRVHALNATYYRRLGIDARECSRSERVLVRSLEGGKYLTRDELREAFERSGITTAGDQRMAYLLMRAELDGVIASGPRRGKQFTYALLSERALNSRELSHEEALTELARRFFISRGPATVHDFAKWSGLTVASARTGAENAASALVHETIEGRAYWSSPDKLRAAKDTPRAHLLSIYDEYISSYRDRGAIASAEVAKKLMGFGNALLYVVILDGRVVGTWKRTLGGKSVTIETTFFERLAKADLAAVAAERERYSRFVELPLAR
jgi:hypothetical protein